MCHPCECEDPCSESCRMDSRLRGNDRNIINLNIYERIQGQYRKINN